MTLHVEGDRLTEGDVRLLGNDRIKAIPLLLLARLQLRLVVRPLVQVVDRLPRFVCHLLAELDHLGEDDLLFCGEQPNTTDLLQVHADRIVNADRLGHRFGDRLGDLRHFGRRNLKQRRSGGLWIKDLYAVRLNLSEIASARLSDTCKLRRWIWLRSRPLLRRPTLRRWALPLCRDGGDRRRLRFYLHGWLRGRLRGWLWSWLWSYLPFRFYECLS